MPEWENETCIVVRRACDCFGIMRGLRVIIDGEEVGSLRYGGRGEYPVRPGWRAVRVAMDWGRSKPCVVFVGPGEVAEVEGGLRWRGLRWAFNFAAAFATPRTLFVVRPVGERPGGPGWGEPWDSLSAVLGVGLLLSIFFLVAWAVGG